MIEKKETFVQTETIEEVARVRTVNVYTDTETGAQRFEGLDVQVRVDVNIGPNIRFGIPMEIAFVIPATTLEDAFKFWDQVHDGCQKDIQKKAARRVGFDLDKKIKAPLPGGKIPPPPGAGPFGSSRN